MELKARLASIEHQINSLQNALTNDENINYRNIQFRDDSNKNNNLKTILMSKRVSIFLLNSQLYVFLGLKMEHEAVLQNIEKALEIVDCPNQLKTPERTRNSTNFGSPQSPRLRDKINNAILGTSAFGGSPTSGASNTRRTNSSSVIMSSPLSPAVEKSHITFDILNELDYQNMPPTKQRKVHFENLGNGGKGELSVASREYLKKYGLL